MIYKLMHAKAPPQLVCLNAATRDENGASSCCSGELLQQISHLLLHPSVPLSSAAAQQLSNQQVNAGHFVYSTAQADNCTDSFASTRSTTTTPPQQQQQQLLLKSLPVELLYDDAGLQLFDQITTLEEYYLTAAEAEILGTHAADILSSCGVTDGTMLVELGAGSMRKTRLLLEAVLAGGHLGVTFCALDLCKASLEEALQALAGVVQGQVQLVGLVGTYEQGLSYISRGQQQQQLARASSSISGISAGCSSSSTEGGSSAQLLLQDGQSPESSEDVCPAGLDDSSSMALLDGTGCATDVDNYDDDNDDDGDDGDVCIAIESQAVTSCIAGYGSADCSADVAAGDSSSGKVLMWLGSSIGNYGRDQARAFMQRIGELAMQPGDKLLVGIDRRNPAPKVALAYNDPQGVTRDFILNGLHHAVHLLDNQLQQLQVPHAAAAAAAAGAAGNKGTPTTTAGAAAGAAAEGSCSSAGSCLQPAVFPEHFEYFSVYNDKLGRHEAYYRANQDTRILLPPVHIAAAAAAAEPAATGAAVSQEMTSDIEGLCAGSGSTDSGSTDSDINPVVQVRVHAGELIHIEYSHKYSHQEVMELAAGAGLQWVQAWTDSAEQYDLHMFCLPGGS